MERVVCKAVRETNCKLLVIDCLGDRGKMVRHRSPDTWIGDLWCIV